MEKKKQDALSALISALVEYRKSAKESGRKRLADWADRTIAQFKAYAHVTKDIRMENAIAAFHHAHVASVPVGEELLRSFRKTLTLNEFNALLDACVERDS